MPITRSSIHSTARLALSHGSLAALATLAAFAIGACQSSSAAPTMPATREAWAEPGKPLDASALSDTALAGLVRAERAFMDDVARRGLEGWVGNFGDSAATFPSGSPVAVGRAAIRARMTATFADSSVHVAWHPVYATVATSGELGYTYGYYRWTSRDEKGAPAPPLEGKYLTVWRRDPAGRWRVVVDVGNGNPVPASFFADAAAGR